MWLTSRSDNADYLDIKVLPKILLDFHADILVMVYVHQKLLNTGCGKSQHECVFIYKMYLFSIWDFCEVIFQNLLYESIHYIELNWINLFLSWEAGGRPQDLMKSRIALEYDRDIGCVTAEAPVRIQSNWKSLNPRSCSKKSACLVNRGPDQDGHNTMTSRARSF